MAPSPPGAAGRQIVPRRLPIFIAEGSFEKDYEVHYLPQMFIIDPRGRILFDGMDLALDPIAVKARLGIVPQETALYENLTGRENLRFWGGLYGLSGKQLDQAVDRVLDQVGLSSRARDPVKTYSGGMKRRLNLGMGLVHSPHAVLMDEPTVGIDVQARLNILEAVRQVVASGATVLYTTHYLEEAESLCDRIGIMDHGRILAEGTLDELKRRVGNK